MSPTMARQSLIATPRERAQAVAFSEGMLDPHAGPAGVHLADGRSVPPELAGLLRRVIQAIANGQMVTVGTLPEALTTSAAAQMLGVSRPTLMKMVRNGTIPSHKVGTHTRINTTDVVAARRVRLEQQQKAFDELRALEEELDLQ